MKYKHFTWVITKNMWYILPTIMIDWDDPWYTCKNISIEIHWLCFHCRWFFKEDLE